MSHEPAIRRPSISPLPPLGRARQVAEALSSYIEAARLGPGDRLPTERELMAGAGGRPLDHPRGDPPLPGARRRSRRARAAAPISLKPISAGTIHMPLSIDTARLRDALLQTLEVRRGIEVEASMVAARRRTAADLERHRGRSSTRWSACTSRRARRARRTWPSTSRSTTPRTIRCSGSCWSRCARRFERFWDQPFDRPDFARAVVPVPPRAVRRDRATATPRPRARQDAAQSSTIVEEDIKEMSK